MSWQTINKIITLAVIDTQFANKLLNDPLQAVREAGFCLTTDEEQVFREIKARTLADLSQQLLARIGNESP